MSYTVSITKANVPSSNKDAWSYLGELNKTYFQSTSEPGKIFLDLLTNLEKKYPDAGINASDEEIGDCVWSDGPLKNNAGKEMMRLGVTFPSAESVIPFLIQKAHELNLVVFDEQTEQIHRPQNKFKKFLKTIKKYEQRFLDYNNRWPKIISKGKMDLLD